MKTEQGKQVVAWLQNISPIAVFEVQCQYCPRIIERNKPSSAKRKYTCFPCKQLRQIELSHKRKPTRARK